MKTSYRPPPISDKQGLLRKIIMFLKIYYDIEVCSFVRHCIVFGTQEYIKSHNSPQIKKEEKAIIESLLESIQKENLDNENYFPIP